MVISYSSTFEYFPSSSPLICISEEKKKKVLKTQSNDHRVVTRGQKHFKYHIKNLMISKFKNSLYWTKYYLD